MTKRTVLIIEDNPITRKVVRLTLGLEGFHVLEAADAAEALRLVAQSPPDLILQDLLLPDMDGFDLVRLLRMDPHTAGVPIIAFSGFLSRLEHGRAAAAGFTDFLPKPVDPSRLVEVVETYLPAATVEPAEIGHNRRLLVVDDDAVQLKLARLLLMGLGFLVTTANDGAEALETLHEQPIDAVFSDVLMPRVDGFRLCADMRGDPGLAGIPVVLVSSNYVEEADRQVAIRMGANAFVIRTPDLGIAIRALEAALDQSIPAPTLAPPPAPDEHHQRVLLQLERHAAMNATYAHRSAVHASMLSVLAGVSEALIKSQSLEQALPGVLSSLLEAAGVSHGAIFARHQKDGNLVLGAAAGYDVQICAKLERFCGQPRLFEDAAALLSPVLLAMEKCLDASVIQVLTGISAQCAMLIPLVSDQESLGLLLLASDTRDLSESDWVPFSRTMAVQIGQALALNRAFSQLKTSESRYRRVVENAGEGIFTLDAQHRFSDVNPAMEAILQRSREDVLGRLYSDMVAPGNQQQADSACDDLLVGGEVKTMGRLLRADGQVAICDVSVTTMDIDGASMAIGIARDVTEKRRDEAELQLLRSLSLAVSDAPDLTSALQVTLRLICKTTRLCYGAAWLPRDGALECAQWWTLDGAARERFRPLTEPKFAPGEGILGKLWISGEPCSLHTPALLIAPRRSSADELGIQAGLAVPMVVEAEVVAVLEFFSMSLAECERLAPLIGAAAGQVSAVIGRHSAQTALRVSQEQLRQAQKMEAVGRLAGGVAHDFNNLLSIILSYSDLILEGLAPDALMREDLEEILKAGKRGAELTRKLLMFSRQQVMVPEVLDLNEVLDELDKMLRRVLGADVDMVSVPGADLDPVMADRGNIEQLVMNLVVNARDAMPTGGRLTLETANIHLDEGYVREHVGAQIGHHVLLVVTDNGSGMCPATQSRVFEPFFTTKRTGMGTGLGLSTVFGIVQASRGSIRIQSAEGIGTSINIYLPRAEAEAGTELKPAPTPTAVVLGGSERILLVEDQDEVRTLAASILRKKGYTVVEAAGAEPALMISGDPTERLDLLLTDVVMPGVSGPQLAKQVNAQRPELKVLFMSGYTDDTVFRHGVLESQMAYIQKPITPQSLARKVREVLDA